MTTGNLAPQPVSDATSWTLMDGRYASLAALRTSHLDLLMRYESNRGKPSEEFLDEVEVFLERGERTGSMIESKTDRRAAQVLLDYWNALLFRCGRNRPVAILAEYDTTIEARLTFDNSDCPYPGLVPFSTNQSTRFFGRDALVGDAVRLLQTARIVALLGAPASGKTSVVRAGILPALSSGAIDESGGWQYIVATLGANPLEQLVRTCLPNADEHVVAVTIDKMRADPSVLAILLAERQPALIFVDQLEELYDTTDVAMVGDRETVLRQLEHIASASNLDVRMIVAACVDDVLTPDTYSTVLLPPESRIDLPRMGTRELSDAILQPADQIGLKFDEGVVPDLVRTLVTVPGVLPLLQFVMLELWDRRDHNRITRDAFNAVLWDPQRRRPNVVVSITRKADALYSQFSQADRGVADPLLLQLVDPGLGWDFALISPRVSDLHVEGTSAADVERVLGAFEAARLVQRNKLDAEASPRVRLTHETLPRYWPRLIDLLDARRHEQRQRLRLGDATRQWLERNRDRTLLWSGLLRQEAQGYTDLTPEEREFLDESDQAEYLASRRRTQVIVALIGLLGVALFFFIVAAISLYQLNKVSTSAQLAAQAQIQADANPDRAMLLAERAYRLDQNSATRLGLLSVVDHNIPLIEDLSEAATAMAVSPDGHIVAIGHADGAIDVWVDGQHSVDTLGTDPSSPPVAALAFGPDSKTLLSVVRGGQMTYWDPLARQEIAPPQQLPSALPDQLVQHSADTPIPSIGSLAISSHGDLAVAGAQSSSAANVYLWDAARRAWQPSIASARGDLTLAFTPDGGQLLLGRSDCRAAAAAACTNLKLLPVHAGTADAQPSAAAGYIGASVGGVGNIAFGPRGTVLAFGDDDGVALWDLQHNRLIGRVATSPGPPNEQASRFSQSIAVSADDSIVAVGGCDLWNAGGTECLRGQVGFWSTDDGSSVGSVISGHQGFVNQVAFMANNNHLISRGPDSVLAWDRGATQVDQPGWPVVDDTSVVEAAQLLALQPSGTFAVASQSSVNVWQHQSDGRLKQLTPLAAPALVRALALDADGVPVTGGVDGRVILWQATQESQHPWSARQILVRAPGDTPSGPDPITSLAMADQKQSRLVAGGALGDVILWDLNTSTSSVLAPATPSGLMTNAVAISADGNLIAAGGCDPSGVLYQQTIRCNLGRISLWDLRKSPRRTSLPGHASTVGRLAFDSDGTLLASIGDDGSVIVWSAETGQPIQQFVGLTDARGLQFLPDGTLEVYDPDARLQYKLVGLKGMEARACAVAHRSGLSADEWDKAITATSPLQPLLEVFQHVRDNVCS